MSLRNKRRDIDATYNALRPRLGKISVSGGGSGSTTLPAHTHAASVITVVAAGNIAADDAQEALEELDSEKLARDGTQTMLGDLDMNHYDIINIVDADIEGNATVGLDIIQTGPEGSARITGNRGLDMSGSNSAEGVIEGPRVISMQGFEAEAEARIEDVKAVAWVAVTPTPEVGRMAWDETEDTIVVFVDSGSV
jgi:hypothetical protein